MEFDKDYEMKRLEIIERKLELQEKTVKRKSIIRFLLGTLLGLMVGASIWRLFDSEIPTGNKDVLIALVSGMTGAFFGAVVNYYFGDSDNSPDSGLKEVEAPNPTKEYESVGKDY